MKIVLSIRVDSIELGTLIQHYRNTGNARALLTRSSVITTAISDFIHQSSLPLISPADAEQLMIDEKMFIGKTAEQFREEERSLPSSVDNKMLELAKLVLADQTANPRFYATPDLKHHRIEQLRKQMDE